MMAPNLNLSDRTTVPNDLSVCISSEDDIGTLSNTATDSTDKTHNTNSQCSSMSDGESYECYGEGEIDSTSPVISHQHLNGTGLTSTPNCLDLKRNTWQRTSLRRSPAKHSNNNNNNNEALPNRKWGSLRQPSGKRIGSNALASQLYRSSSFNSSGRSSNCDTAEDVYSDVSLEEDVLDLNHKVQMLQQQMSVLADNQNHSDERYTRAKQENATLQARILMLEEQLREIELRSEEKLIEEEKRHRELVARVDREKQLQVENCAIKLQTLELANSNLKEEAARCKSDYEMQRKENEKLEEKLEETGSLVANLRQEIQTLRDREKKYKEQLSATERLLDELSREVEKLKTEKLSALAALQDCKETPSQIETELHAQLDSVRQDYKNLQESYDELQAILLTRSVQEGRNLLTGSNNLAAELEEMTNDDRYDATVENELKIRTALKEQQEVNAQLRTYIDTILLNIVENYPQLLEVKGPNIN